MNFKNLLIFIIILSLIGGISFISINGIEVGKFKLASIKESMNLGLDLKGGVLVVLEAQTDETGSELDRKVEEAKSIISKRINELGLTEPKIVREGEKRIRIELPGVENTQEAQNVIGKTAELKFITLDTAIPDDFSEFTNEEKKEFFDKHGTVILTGKNIKDSKPVYDNDNLPVVSLELDSEGDKKFFDITTKLSKTRGILYIVLDNNIISSPYVDEPISGGSAIIRGSFSIKEATTLSALIRGGALPVEMKEVQSSIIGPTLGLESLDKSLYAGIIGILLIFLFMIIYYRIPGFVASISLVIYIIAVLGTLVSLNATLTLPGIAGLILSIGMAVDANVIIFERIKEELRLGKTVRSSVDFGFKKALSTVLDANITTLIAGIVLFKFGTGPIKGFAVTLMIGIFVSLITSIFITRYLLKLIIGMNITKNSKLYGA